MSEKFSFALGASWLQVRALARPENFFRDSGSYHPLVRLDAHFRQNVMERHEGVTMNPTQARELANALNQIADAAEQMAAEITATKNQA